MRTGCRTDADQEYAETALLVVMKIIDKIAAGAILGLAAFSISQHVKASQDWKRSGILAQRAIASAKRHTIKEMK